jgi:hypothetical protein
MKVHPAMLMKTKGGEKSLFVCVSLPVACKPATSNSTVIPAAAGIHDGPRRAGVTKFPKCCIKNAGASGDVIEN